MTRLVLAAAIAGAIAGLGLAAPAHRPAAPAPAVTPLDRLLLEPVLGPDELAPADNP